MSATHQYASMTSEQAKSAAKNLKSRLNALGVDLSIGHAYEALAASHGFANWSTMKATLDTVVAQPKGAEASGTAVEDFKAKLRAAAVKAAGERKSSLLYIDIKKAMEATVDECVADPASAALLVAALPRFLVQNDPMDGASISVSLKRYLMNEVGPQINDTIAMLFALDVKGYLASSLRLAESRMTSFAVATKKPEYLPTGLGVDILDLASFTTKASKLADDYIWIGRNAAIRAGAVSEEEIVPDASHLSSRLHSILYLVRFNPDLAFQMFMSERGNLWADR